MAADSVLMRLAAVAPSFSALRSIRLGFNRNSGQLCQQVGRGGEQFGGPGAGHHPAQSRRRRRPGDTELVVTRNDPAPARAAVVVGAAQRDRPEHALDRLGPVAHELGRMSRAVVDPWPAVAGVGRQQPAQQRSAQPHHRGADRQLHRGQALTGGAQRARRERGQPVYLGRELRFERLAEPPFSARVSAADETVLAGSGGRASEIAAKRW
jgi:hypothetical protein